MEGKVDKKRSRMDQYNWKEVVRLLNIARGERSFREYALDAGVTPANLYRIRKGDYKPSPQMLRTLTSEKASPRGNVTFNDLMRACGYQEEDDIFRFAYDYLEEREANKDKKTKTSLEKRRELRLNEEKFRNISEGLFLKRLSEKGIEFANCPETDIKSSNDRIRIDAKVKVRNQSIKEWLIEFKYYSRESSPSRFASSFKINMMFGELVRIPPNKTRKISFIVNDKDFFEQISEYRNKLSYRGELSVILIDTENFKVEKEVYLSHFDENDKSMEIKLN